MTGNCHVRCGAGENSEIISKYYLSLFGTIPRFEELLATMRSMEISANVIIQNISQLKKMYKDSWENVLGNCDSLLFLGGQEPTTLEHISKTLGKETIDTRSNNRTRGRNGSTSENDGILGRELMTVDELKIMKDNECILFVRGLYPFFCDKFVIEKHPNYKLLEDFDSQNAYLIKDIETVKFNDSSGAEDEDLHSETVDEEVFEQINSAEKIGNEISQNGEDVPQKNIDKVEQSVTIEEIVSGEIVGNENHLHNNFPKRPKNGSEPANLDNTEVLVTSEPHLKPPFIEVAEENYLDIFDEI